MSLREVTGGLLSIADRGEAIGHGCNCEGVMGGLAAKVAARWPALEGDYVAACHARTFTLGGVLPWLDEDTGVWIYNLATQQRPGADARIDAIEQSVRAAIDHARGHRVPKLYLPRIGSGIGGLQWDDVRAALQRIADTADDVELVVVSLG